MANRLGVALILLILLLPAALAEDKADDPKPEVKHRLPVLSSVYPQGSAPGTSIRVEVLGEYLDRAATVVFSGSDIRGKVLSGTSTTLALEFEVASGARYGHHQFRVVSPRGASNVLLFRIGDQPHLLENEPNSAFEEAQKVTLPVTINARLNRDGEFDFFQFEAKAGETWIFDLRSARNGNGLDPALILLDSRRRKLAHIEDLFIWDPFFIHTFAESGTYYAVVQPTHTRLDPNFAYQLDIRKSPHLSTISPLSFSPGAEREATVYGAGLAGESPRLWFDAAGIEGDVLELRGNTARIKIRTKTAKAGPVQFAIVTEHGRSNSAQLIVDPTPPHTGGEKIQAPVSIAGIAQYRKPERWSFDAKAGEMLVFEVRAHRFGSPTDSVLRILDDKGKQIAINDDGIFPGVAFNKDSRLSHTFKETGRYTLEMRNVVAVTGEHYPYQLVVAAPKPSFELMLGTDQPYVYCGQGGSLNVKAERRDGHDAPIRLQMAGLPEGIAAEPVEIPAGKNEAVIAFQCEGVKAGMFGSLQIHANDASGPAWRSARVSSGGGEGATFTRVESAVLVAAQQPAFSLEPKINSVNLVRGGTAEIPYEITRAAGFNGEIRFRAENLPSGVSLVTGSAPSGSNSVIIRLRASEDAATGRYPRVKLLGFAPDAPNGEEAPRITLLVD
jgi:hypothetical protein